LIADAKTCVHHRRCARPVPDLARKVINFLPINEILIIRDTHPALG